jgi:hypothetical protein
MINSMIVPQSPDLRLVFKHYHLLTKVVCVESGIEDEKVNISFEAYPPKMYIEDNCLYLESTDGKKMKFDEETTRRVRSEYMLNYDYNNES